MEYFQTRFLEEVELFISTLDSKTIKKVFYNIEVAQQTNDPKLFKKLENDIWEFRTIHNKLQIHLLAFWDKTETKQTLVIETHGFIKKTSKIPKSEIEKQSE